MLLDQQRLYSGLNVNRQVEARVPEFDAMYASTAVGGGGGGGGGCVSAFGTPASYSEPKIQ
jgi:hypothetical protein